MIQHIYRKLLQLLPKKYKKKLPIRVGVFSISEKKSKAVNNQYRKKKKPANVLSFRYGPEYGEILVCPEIIRKEARDAKQSFQYQMTWMILHGMLHVAGFDHEKSRIQAKIMERMEKRILGRMFKTRN